MLCYCENEECVKGEKRILDGWGSVRIYTDQIGEHCTNCNACCEIGVMTLAYTTLRRDRPLLPQLQKKKGVV